MSINRSAVISDDGLYRYRLDRWWGEGPRVAWIMLNPSTADADVDDPTIRRCIGFTKAWGYDGLTVVNLYPFRATKPRDLYHWLRNRPNGLAVNRNSSVLDEVASVAPLVVTAWGANADPGDVLPPPPDWCHLGLTKGGHPRHPLYVRADTKPVEWGAA